MKKDKELYAEYTVRCFRQRASDSPTSKIVIEVEQKRADIFSGGFSFTPEIIVIPKELEAEMLTRFDVKIYPELCVSVNKFALYCSYRLAVLNEDQKQIKLLEFLFEQWSGETITDYDHGISEIQLSNQKKGRKSKKPSDWTLIEFARSYKKQLAFLESLESQYKEFYDNSKGSQAARRKQACEQLKQIYFDKSEALPEDVIVWVKNKPIKPSHKALQLAAKLRGIPSQGVRTLLKWQQEGDQLLAKGQIIIEENFPDIDDKK